MPSLIVFVALLLVLVSAQDDNRTRQLKIYDNSTQFSYKGCFRHIEDSYAFKDLAWLTVPDGMTVPQCLDYCALVKTNRFAGLRALGECWCSRSMKKKAITLNGTECNSPCDGDSSMACGGREELSVYKLSRASQMHVSTLLALCALTLVTLL